MAATLYGIVDTASDRRLHGLVTETPEHVCLFAGPLQPPLERTAPYLVNLGAAKNLATEWRREWGRNWGILCVSGADIGALRKHFRRFLQARLPNGQIVLFRFYDPRVFRVYLPACDTPRLASWFTDVHTYRLAAEDGVATRVFEMGHDGLSQR